MANTPNKKPILKKLSIEEYSKLKEKIAKSKLSLQFPLMIKLGIALPLAYLLFMVIYYIVHIMHLAEH
jgi:hypothetical protein